MGPIDWLSEGKYPRKNLGHLIISNAYFTNDIILITVTSRHLSAVLSDFLRESTTFFESRSSLRLPSSDLTLPLQNTWLTDRIARAWSAFLSNLEAARIYGIIYTWVESKFWPGSGLRNFRPVFNNSAWSEGLIGAFWDFLERLQNSLVHKVGGLNA